MKNNKVAQTHFGVGDNIAGDKIISDSASEERQIPLWLQYGVAVATILGLLWTIYTYFFSHGS